MEPLDSRDYYKGLINHYEDLLKLPIWSRYEKFIKEEQRLCTIKLNKIKEADIEAILLTGRLSRFLFTE